MKNLKKSFLMSTVALLLCFLMFLGTTFAWFTDEVTSSANKIIAGNLKLDLEVLDKATGAWYSVKENSDPIFNYENWEPGYTNATFLKVENEGNLALKWQARFSSSNGVSKLAEVIDVYVLPSETELSYNNLTRDLDGWQKVGTLDQFINTLSDTTYGYLEEAGEVAYLGIALHMQEDAGNEYQGIGLEAFDIQIVATQMSHEDDSFGPDYDNDAEWPEGEMNFEATQSLANVSIINGELAEDVIIRHESGAYAVVPAGVKLADGVTELKFSGKGVDGNGNFADDAKSYDIHIEGIADDNTKCITVYIGKILDAGLGETELKLYHEDTQMTRVNGVEDFAINNQFTYDSATGAVVLYVDNFSVFSGVVTSADVWDGDENGADTSWYVGHENDTEYTLMTADQLVGFRQLFDGGNTFAGKTVKLGADIDLAGKLFNPIGGGWAYNGGKTFNGTFDGGNHTIYNIYVNGWELDETGDTHSGTSMGAGLFSYIHNATIKNLAISGAEMVVETTSIGIVAGCAQGKCTFDNIVVTNATLGNYQMRNGGIVGDIYVIESDNVPEGEYSHTFTNITVGSSVKLCSMWGDFDTGNGGVIGGKYGSATVLMQNVTVACELDVFSDVTAAYQWYAYRRCGMLIGYTGQNSPKQATNAAADFLTCQNVNVYYGDWVNYTYYQFTNQTDAQGNRLWNSNYPWVRAEESDYNGPFSNVRYGNPIIKGEKINTLELAQNNCDESVTITFNQLYGGGQGVYGTASHTANNSTVKVYKISEIASTTVRFQNNGSWDNVKIEYYFAHGNDTWSTLVEGLDATSVDPDGTYNVYTFTIPSIAHSFKITGTKGGVDVSTPEHKLTDLINDEIYALNIAGTELVETRKVTFTPDTTWKSDGARFALYAFDANNNNIWYNLKAEGSNYVCYVPDGYTGADICRMNPNGADKTNNGNNFANKWNQTADIALSENKDYTYKTKLYFVPNNNWKSNGARFAAYFFKGNTVKWVDMTYNSTLGVYECEIPEGTDWANVIFCRFNGSSTTNGWTSDMWNQTNDLEYFGEDVYHVDEGQWSKGSGYWSPIR